MAAVADSVGHSMGGSSGALYQIFFLALAGGQLSSPECQYVAVLSKTSHNLACALFVCIMMERNKIKKKDEVQLWVHLMLAAFVGPSCVDCTKQMASQ